MLDSIYHQLGPVGTLVVVILGTAVIFFWTLAVAVVVTSPLHWSVKLLLHLLLALLPPLGLVVLPICMLRNRRIRRAYEAAEEKETVQDVPAVEWVTAEKTVASVSQRP